MYRILIADPLDPSGLELLAAAGAEVHQLTDEERPRLAEVLADYDALVVRSTTKVTADLLRAGKRLKVVGRAGIGVDNVDVAAATDLGILVVNAPTANLLSATEHTFALLLALARSVPAADASIKAGKWDRKPFVGVELQGKTLGVIGFGRIGQQVAARAARLRDEGAGLRPVPRRPGGAPARRRAAAARRAARRVRRGHLPHPAHRADPQPAGRRADRPHEAGGAADQLRPRRRGRRGGAARGARERPPRRRRARRLRRGAAERPAARAPPQGGGDAAPRRPDPRGAGADLDRDRRDGARRARRLARGGGGQPAVPPRRPAPAAGSSPTCCSASASAAPPASCWAARRSACRSTSGGSTRRSACRSRWRCSRGCSDRSWARGSTTSTPSGSPRAAASRWCARPTAGRPTTRTWSA